MENVNIVKEAALFGTEIWWIWNLASGLNSGIQVILHTILLG